MLKPLRDHILVKPLDRQDSKIIHVVTNKRMFRAEVIAVGPGRYDKGNGNLKQTLKPRPLDVKVGDIVNFGETHVKFDTYEEDGKKYWIIQEGDVGFIEERQ